MTITSFPEQPPRPWEPPFSCHLSPHLHQTCGSWTIQVNFLSPTHILYKLSPLGHTKLPWAASYLRENYILPTCLHPTPANLMFLNNTDHRSRNIKFKDTHQRSATPGPLRLTPSQNLLQQEHAGTKNVHMAKGPWNDKVNQCNMTLLKHSYPTTVHCGYSNTSESQENDLKSNLLKMIVAFKQETNKSIKDIQKIKLCKTWK